MVLVGKTGGMPAGAGASTTCTGEWASYRKGDDGV